MNKGGAKAERGYPGPMSGRLWTDTVPLDINAAPHGSKLGSRLQCSIKSLATDHTSSQPGFHLPYKRTSPVS